jgi:serine/threonine protein kinase
MIGPYKLLQQIGEGGMGVVYMAEQQQPLRRKVALKIIKPGMDSAQVIARFEAERQALAMMDHQNIAKVFDAGTTDTGRPYFVMELVHGVPITKFCDNNQLTPRERLALFVPVCQAIQHAHQKGIIHRDIKPSNVLVTMYDDKPVPKVIDFGVAKAIEQRLTERTLFTQFGVFVGTFEYMSPEQAEMNALGVDTRSDIYSLGVLLYELLTSTTPLQRERLGRAALDELVRLIKQEEPPRPSLRLSSSDNLPKIAAARKTEPARLSKLVRGEIDWIVMKCLEKDRSRRYETANALARDVERYLHDEPVEASPPSAGYRLRKFARKYRLAVTVAAMFVLLLVTGVIVSTWQAVRAMRAEGEAVAHRELAMDAEREAIVKRQEAEAAEEQEQRSRTCAGSGMPQASVRCSMLGTPARWLA